jgi:hypothetical protein
VKPKFTDDDIRLLSEEADRLQHAWSKTDFLGKSLELSRGVVWSLQESADLVTRLAVSSLIERAPFSLIRFGDGEGNVLALLGETSNTDLNLKAFNAMFYSQDLQCLSDAEAQRFCRSLECSVHSADVLGIRSFNPWHHSTFDSLELSYARGCLARRDARGAHGLLHARKQVERLLEMGRLSEAILTHAWVYISLIPALPEIVDACKKLIVITGREELRSSFLSRFGSKEIDFISIPLEGRRRSRKNRMRHYPDVYEHVLKGIEGNLAGTLVIVGAGIFGKVYCHTAKQHGAVALDLGSAFDLMSGIKTRPIHARFGDLSFIAAGSDQKDASGA